MVNVVRMGIILMSIIDDFKMHETCMMRSRGSVWGPGVRHICPFKEQLDVRFGGQVVRMGIILMSIIDDFKMHETCMMRSRGSVWGPGVVFGAQTLEPGGVDSRLPVTVQQLTIQRIERRRLVLDPKPFLYMAPGCRRPLPVGIGRCKHRTHGRAHPVHVAGRD